jgi:hypothetical protein
LGLLGAVLVIALRPETDLDDAGTNAADAGNTARFEVGGAVAPEAEARAVLADLEDETPFTLPSFVPSVGPGSARPVPDAGLPGRSLAPDGATKGDDALKSLGPLPPPPPAAHARADGGFDAGAPPRGLTIQAPAPVVSLEGRQGAGGAPAKDPGDAGALAPPGAAPPRTETRLLRSRRTSRTDEGEAIHRVAGFASNGGLSLQGRVIDADTQRPVANACVEARMGDAFVETRTDGAGAFRLPGLAPSSHIVLWVQGDDTTFVAESVDVVVPESGETIDAGTIRVLSANEFAPDLGGWLGLFVGRRGGHTVVRAVNPWLPADRAGIQVGDHLLSVDGRDVSELGIRGINVLLRGPVGSKVTLILQTGTQPPRKLVLARVQR